MITGNIAIMAALLTELFISDTAWRSLAIETGLTGLAATPVLTTSDMQSWFRHNHTARKAAMDLVRQITFQILISN
jgi:hypothetical protein